MLHTSRRVSRIGMLDRTLVAGSLRGGHPEAMAELVALNRVARFPEFKGRGECRLAESLPVGTILSDLLALAVCDRSRSALPASWWGTPVRPLSPADGSGPSLLCWAGIRNLAMRPLGDTSPR